MRPFPLLALLLPACSEYGFSRPEEPLASLSPGAEAPEGPGPTPPVQGWRVSVAETCNGRDDDGDGRVDEDQPDHDGDGVADCTDDTCTIEELEGEDADALGTCGGATTVLDPYEIDVLWRYETDGVKGMGPVTPPMVARLTDDDGDGDVDAGDPLDVAVMSPIGHFYQLVVLDAATGDVHWESGGNWSYWSYLQIADVNQDGRAEVLVLDQQNRINAFEGDGSILWTSTCITDAATGGGSPGFSVGDLDADGDLEVVGETHVYDGATGAYEYALDRTQILFAGPLTVADLDGDGPSEVLYAGGAYEADGAERFGPLGRNAEGLQMAVVDVDGDGRAEVVNAGDDELVFRDGETGDALVSVRTSVGDVGPLCTGDLDGDGVVELVLPGMSGLAAYDLEGNERWSATVSASGYASCSTFDMDGDGAAEVLFADQAQIYAFDGCTGDVEWSDATVGSSYSSTYPVVADVDEDGFPEILASGTTAARSMGVTVYRNLGSGWPAGPDAWPQWDAGVDKVDAYGGFVADGSWWRDDATLRGVPAETPASLDLAIVEGDTCVSGCADTSVRRVAVQVRNRGQATVRDAVVTLSAADGTLLATELVPTLGPADLSESIVLEVARAGAEGELTARVSAEGDTEPSNDTLLVEDECP